MDAKTRFYKLFQDEVGALQERIGQLASISTTGGERKFAIEHVQAGISQLSTRVADVSDSVPSHDQKTYSEVIKALKDELNQEVARLAPRAPFQFKARKVNAAATEGENHAKGEDARHLKRVAFDAPDATAAEESAKTEPKAEEIDSVSALPSFRKNYNDEVARSTGPGVRQPSFSSANEIVLSGHDSIHITLPSSAANATTSGNLTELKSCVVDMSIPTSTGEDGAFASLALKDIARSLVIVGHVDGPVHITGLTDSVLVVAARQVRMHECRNVAVYLHCTSRPIIEDCTEMRFAPLPQYYMGPNDKADQNQWDQVDDFKWLKAEQSPNWSILSVEDRLPDKLWETEVRDTIKLGAIDILKKAGISRR